MSFLKRRALPIGIILMYAFTWPPYLASAGVIHVRFALFIRMLPGWGFIYASVLPSPALTIGIFK